MLLNAPEKIGGPRYRPDRRFGMSQGNLATPVATMLNWRRTVPEMGETSSG